MKAADRTRQLFVAAVVGAGMLLLTAPAALASHEGTDYDPNDFCHYADSGMADVEDGPVDEDTGLSDYCQKTVEATGGGFPDAGGVGDVGAGDVGDEDGIVPAARIDAGGGGAAASGLHPAQLAVAAAAGSLAIGAARARRRR